MKRFSYLKTMPKTELILWTVIRLFIVGWFIYEIFNANTKDALQALFSLIFTFLWDMFQIFGGKSFIKNVSSHAQTALILFILFGSLIGTKFKLYIDLEWYDLVLHFFSGAISAWFGYDFAFIVQGKKRPLSPALAALFSLGFAFFIAVGWEFFEFSMDTLHGTHLQMSTPDSDSGLIDTMTDLISCAVGTVPTAILTAMQRNGYIGRNRKERREQIKKEQEIWNKSFEIAQKLKEEETKKEVGKK